MTSNIPPRVKPQARRRAPQALANKNVIPPDAADLFKKRRTGLWTIGVAVIVAAGAIMGAQLKSRQQDRERLKDVQLQGFEAPVTADANSAGVSVPSAQTAHDAASSEEMIKSKPNMQSALNSTNSTPSSVPNERRTNYNQRQISFLEDRRGVLISQKFDLERKIERVREKKMKEENLAERRREASAGDDR